MSSYTTELRYLIENNYDIGLKNYPIFQESYRDTLNSKIINHYYFREIGLETEALFVNKLNTKMNEIMPYYNKLYETELLKLNPLKPYNIEEKHTKTGDLTNTSNSESTSENTGTATNNQTDTTKHGKISKFSDVAQGQVTANSITNDEYLTNATVNSGTDTLTQTGSANNESSASGTSKSNSNLTSNEDITITRIGNIGNMTESEMLLKYRKTFLNIDMMIIKELSELFMGVW